MAQIQRYGNEPRIIGAIRFRESQFTCEREHRHVVAQNASVQTPHAVCTGILEQPLEQACANAASLPIIGDHHGEFVRRDVIIASVSCDADDVLLTGRAVECQLAFQIVGNDRSNDVFDAVARAGPVLAFARILGPALHGELRLGVHDWRVPARREESLLRCHRGGGAGHRHTLFRKESLPHELVADLFGRVLDQAIQICRIRSLALPRPHELVLM